MKTFAPILFAGAAFLLTSCVADDGYYGSSSYSLGVSSGGYYDNYYGSVYDGYWDRGGGYNFRDGRDRPWRRDDGHHFRRGPADGFHRF